MRVEKANEVLSTMVLAGRFLHTLKDGRIERQGKVIGGLISADPLFLVQWFNFIDGLPTYQSLVPLSTIVSEEWRFYESVDEWSAIGDGLLTEVADLLVFGDEE